jgi:hypothetical protein
VRRDRWEIIKQRIDAIPTPTPPKQTRHWREPLSTKRALRAYYRKKQGIRCFSFAITEEHVDGLVFLGKLLPDQRHNRPTVQLGLRRLPPRSPHPALRKPTPSQSSPPRTHQSHEIGTIISPQNSQKPPPASTATCCSNPTPQPQPAGLFWLSRRRTPRKSSTFGHTEASPSSV